MSKTIYQWAVDYCGDPKSHEARGATILQFLIENGLKPDSHVLDLGCGALSQGTPLIRYLDEGHYVGLDPNGWLIEAALEHDPRLRNKNPLFLYSSDFNASKAEREFDFVVAHSVLSHAAHWQMEQMFSNVRKAVDYGAVWLCSYRDDQYNSFSKEWVYPGVSTFRINTLRSYGFHSGWHINQIHDYRDRLHQVCPNDFHDWIKLTAIASSEEANKLRLDEEAKQREEREIQQIAEDEYRRRREEEARLLEEANV